MSDAPERITEKLRKLSHKYIVEGTQDSQTMLRACIHINAAEERIEQLERERDEARVEAERWRDELEEVDPAPVRILPWETNNE